MWQPLCTNVASHNMTTCLLDKGGMHHYPVREAARSAGKGSAPPDIQHCSLTWFNTGLNLIHRIEVFWTWLNHYVKDSQVKWTHVCKQLVFLCWSHTTNKWLSLPLLPLSKWLKSPTCLKPLVVKQLSNLSSGYPELKETYLVLCTHSLLKLCFQVLLF